MCFNYLDRVKRSNRSRYINFSGIPLASELLHPADLHELLTYRGEVISLREEHRQVLSHANLIQPDGQYFSFGHAFRHHLRDIDR